VRALATTEAIIQTATRVVAFIDQMKLVHGWTSIDRLPPARQHQQPTTSFCRPMTAATLPFRPTFDAVWRT